MRKLVGNATQCTVCAGHAQAWGSTAAAENIKERESEK
jgi:hypothetical protein